MSDELKIVLEILVSLVIPIVMEYINSKKKNTKENIINKNINIIENKKITYVVNIFLEPQKQDTYFRSLCYVLFIVVGFLLFTKFHNFFFMILIFGFELMCFKEEKFFKKYVNISLLLLFVISSFLFIFPVFYNDEYICYINNENYITPKVILSVMFQFIAFVLWFLIIFTNILKGYKTKEKFKNFNLFKTKAKLLASMLFVKK